MVKESGLYPESCELKAHGRQVTTDVLLSKAPIPFAPRAAVTAARCSVCFHYSPDGLNAEVTIYWSLCHLTCKLQKNTKKLYNTFDDSGKIGRAHV